MSKHYLIFIHGMGEPQKIGQAFDPSFAQLWKQLSKNFETITGSSFTQGFEHGYINWHEKLDAVPQSISSVQQLLFEDCYPNLMNYQKQSFFQRLLNFIPYKAHSFATFFLGDVIAYVSKDVNLIRRTLWEQIWFGHGEWQGLEKVLQADKDATYSIVAHSLGSVLAFDYLHHLFQGNPDDPYLPKLNQAERPEDCHLQKREPQRELPDPTDPAIAPLLQERFRYFFTLGAPIGLFMLRNGTLWLNDHPFQKIFNPVRGCDRGWYNFYDPLDAVAFPLTRLFGRNPQNWTCQLEDVAVTNWGIPLAHSHTGYWTHRKVVSKMVNVLSSSVPAQSSAPVASVVEPQLA
ncbi:MAG: hypothetical protein IGS48_21735 [Oscillatoriales cyanobacterium C42_A2020_001]|nr:hypothetical protein [Leptolyngbyaceae cyanobacterium C42_A2020_001]